MTPTRLPAEIRGDVPGLLCNWMPVRHDGHLRGENPGVVRVLADGGVWYASAIERKVVGRSVCLAETCHVGALTELRIDWSSPLALYAALHWLADRRHVATWMLPTTHGGRVEAWDGMSAWDGMTAWEVSALLVSHSVRRVAAGRAGIRDVLGQRQPWLIRSDRRITPGHGGYARKSIRTTTEIHVSDRRWFYGGGGAESQAGERDWTTHPTTPEWEAYACDAADQAALADGCALLVAGGILLLQEGELPVTAL